MAEDGAAVVAALADLGDAEDRLAAQAQAAAEPSTPVAARARAMGPMSTRLVGLTAALVPRTCTMERTDRAVVAEVRLAPRRSSGEDGTVRSRCPGRCPDRRSLPFEIRTQSAIATILTTCETPTFTGSPRPFSAFLNMSQAPHSRALAQACHQGNSNGQRLLD